jgi:predicted permease
MRCFTLINAVMLRSLPVRSPNELVTVGDAARPTALLLGESLANIFSYPLYERLRDENRVFNGLLASGRSGRLEVTVANGAPQQVHGRLVSGNYFEVLGVSPIAGRTFSTQGDQPAGGSPVVVISYDYWVNRFGRSAGVLGTTLRINGSPFIVIGIAPPRFSGEVVGSPTDIWIPLSMQAQVNPGDSRFDKRDSNWLLCIGRLKPGVSIQTARAEITTIVQNALIDYTGASRSPDKVREIRSTSVDVEPGNKGFSWIRKHDSPLLFTLMAVVGLVLLIACTNVANLLLARGTSRQKEISMRLALGADRLRIVRQLFTESLLLAAAAGAAGVFLASWGSRLLSQLVSPASGINPIPFDVDVKPDMAVLAFNAGVSFFTAVLFGLVPALRSTRGDLIQSLKEHAQAMSHGRWRLGRLLVIAQLALSTVILVGAGLFLRSLEHLNSVNVGYSRTVVVMAADLAASGYPAERRVPKIRRVIEVLRSIPGVGGVTVSTNGLFSHMDSSTGSLNAEGFVPTRKDDYLCSFDQIGPNYFKVLGIPLIAGREFNDHDYASSNSPVVINETMARFYFAKGDPLGKYLHNGGDRYTVVGVARDLKEGGLRNKAERRFFEPLFQSAPDSMKTLNFEITTRMAPGSVITAVRRELQSFDQNLKISSVELVSVLIDQDLNGERLIARLSEFFGILVVLLAANGLYGIISYTTARRTSEIGLRMAIGANRGDVIRMVLSETAVLIVTGLAIGLPVALAATRLMSATLASISPNDPGTLAAVSLIMIAAGVLAGLIPATRAARVDPMAALRRQ